MPQHELADSSRSTTSSRKPPSSRKESESVTSRPMSPYHLGQDMSPYRRPISPLVTDSYQPHASSSSQPQRYSTKSAQPGMTAREYGNARIHRSSPLSIPNAVSNGFVTRAAGERQASIGISRSPYAPMSKFFVTVVPPADLKSSDALAANSRGSSSLLISPSYSRRGTLMPLYPTLGGQLYAISREYGLPSIGGLTVYLCDDGEGNLGPRIGEETWPFLWGRYFDEHAEEMYQDITSPLPQSASVSQGDHSGAGRRSSSHSGENAEDDGTTPGRSRTEDGNGQYGSLDARAEHQSRFHNTSFHGNGGMHGGSLSRQYMTPSPMRSSRQDRAFASPSASSLGAGRLPIVARIEWAVDKSRAPWWNQYIGAESSGSIQLTSPQTNAGQRTGRRSMHLPQQVRNGTPAPAGRVSPRNEASLEESKSPPASVAQRSSFAQSDAIGEELPFEERETGGYTHLDDEDESEGLAARDVQDVRYEAPSSSEDDDVQMLRSPVGDSDAQSYAGFSTLMSLVNGNQRSNSSMRDETSEGEEHTREGLTSDATYAFNVDALDEGDEVQWHDLHDAEIRKATLISTRASPADDATTQQSHSRASTVQDWIVKTQSPPKDEVAMMEHLDEEEDAELSPHKTSDVAEVVGLWAEKAISPSGLPSLTGEDTVRVALRDIEPNVSRSSVVSSRRSRDQHALVNVIDSERTSRFSLTNLNGNDTSEANHSPTIKPDAPLDVPAVSLGRRGESADKPSLLSPIALQEDSSTFSGPVAGLSNLLSDGLDHVENDKRDARQRGYSTDSSSVAMPEGDKGYTLSRQGSVSLETPTLSSPAMLSPSRLEPPILRSPGQMSGSSSASEMSDTLMDMERALALLSPAGFGKSPSAVGVPEFGKRTRIKSNISATESMAKARTLSASVSPSLRFFRNSGNEVFPNVPGVTSPSEAGASGSGKEDGNSSPEISTEKKGAMSKAQDESALASDTDDDSDERSGEEDVEGREYDGSHPSEQSALPKTLVEMRSSQSTDEESDAGVSQPTILDGERAEELRSTEHRREEAADDSHIDESYDLESIKDYAMRDQWILAQQQQLPHSPELLAAVSGSDKLVASEHSDAQRASATHSSAAPTYATIGVQAEIASSSRESSQFSLVSGDATSESAEAAKNEGDDASDGSDESRSIGNALRGDENDEIENDAASSSAQPTVNSTPRATAEPFAYQDTEAPKSAELLQVTGKGAGEFGHKADQSLDQNSVFSRLIHGHSISDSVSDVFSSSVPSPNLPNDKDLGPVWMPMTGEQQFTVNGLMGRPDHLEGDLHHELPDDSTTTRGGESTNRTSVASGDQWSQDGSAYEGSPLQYDRSGREEEVRSHHDDDSDEDDNVDDGIDDVMSRKSDARNSHVSSFSSHREALDSIGGRTPTFLYDQHLLDDEQTASDPASNGMVYGTSLLSPISVDRPQSLKSPSPRPAAELGVSQMQTTDEAEGVAASEGRNVPVDALGIEVASPTARTPLPTATEMLLRNGIVSLAGEPVDDENTDLHMPQGFEQVHVVQSPTRPTASSAYAQNDGMTGALNGGKAKQERQGSLLRRSMGSISDRRQTSESSLTEGRRSSAFATAVARPIAMVAGLRRSGSPRLLPRDGGANGHSIRRSMSPHGTRTRFNGLPPSPSLQSNLALLKTNVVSTPNLCQLAPSPNAELPGFAGHASAEDLVRNQSTGFSPSTSSSTSSPNLPLESFHGQQISPPTSSATGYRRQYPASFRIGSPLSIDTKKAQEISQARPYERRVASSSAVDGQDAGQSIVQPVFRGPAASASQPSSPRGPRPPPFASPVSVAATQT